MNTKTNPPADLHTRLAEALAESAAGNVVDLGDFTPYIDAGPETAREIARLRAEVARLRAQVAELLPYAWAGAEALNHWEPYGPDGDQWRNEPARAMLDRITSGEFGPLPEGDGS